MTHIAGFVSILGYPNAGKSTLMNALIGEKLSIITHKAQTTRHRIMGIISGDDYQVVYSDTPGVIRPRYPLQRAMMSAVFSALSDADLILLVTEHDNDFADPDVLGKIQKGQRPVIVAINKIDLTGPDRLPEAVAHWESVLPGAAILPVSALHGVNLDQVMKAILSLLPESPAFYPKDELTDRSQRFFVSEIIREKILLQFMQEIPYSSEVVVESFKEEPQITRISATIYVTRESQKAIILGHKGQSIKKLGTEARKDLEIFLGQHVFLELRIKVSREWRDNETALRRFGYDTAFNDPENTNPQL